MTDNLTSLSPLLSLLEYSLTTAQTTFNKIPGSAVVLRYVKSSHQNDPGRTLLELFLLLFAIRTLLQSRTRADRHFIEFSEKEIDELVDEWTPEPLAPPLTLAEQNDLATIPVIAGPNSSRPKLLLPSSSSSSSSSNAKPTINLATFNFSGLAGNEHIKQRAIETLRKYGLGSCGPPGFYGTLDVHMVLENDIADFLGTEACILYSQGFSTVSSVIPAFCKRGDIIVADRAVNFAIQKGIEISRSTVRWYDHNDLNSLEEVLVSIEKERKRRKAPLTRRFIVTEGIFQKGGAMVDLPKLIEIKYKYKYRLILDETYSFGSVGRTGRGLTELYNVPASKVDILLGSCAIGLNACGGFCAGSQVVVEHQRINGPSFVFSASMPGLLAVSASEGVNIIRNTPSIFENLQANVYAARAILDKLDCITIPSHPASPVIHIYVRQSQPVPTSSHGSSMKYNFVYAPPKDTVQMAEYDIEERLLQEVVEECLAQGVIITRAKRLRGQEMVEPRPSIRLAMTSALTKKETDKAISVLKNVLVKVLGKRR